MTRVHSIPFRRLLLVAVFATSATSTAALALPQAKPAAVQPAETAPPASSEPAAKPPEGGEATPVEGGAEAAAAPTETPPAVEAPAPAVEAPKAAKQRLLVTDLVDKGGAAEMLALINAAVAAQARKSFDGQVTVAAEVKSELELAGQKVLAGCPDDNCYFDAAKVIGADLVIGGNVAKVGDDFLISLIVVNGRDGSRVRQVQRKTPSTQEFAAFSAGQIAALGLTGNPTSDAVPVLVRLTSGPEGAVVRLDGKDVGSPPVSLTVSPGSHSFEITADGYAPYRTTINVENGSPALIDAKLSADALDLWPVAAGMGAAGVVALGTGLAFGALAQLNYDGTWLGLPLGNPDESYSLKSPATSIELAEKQQTITQFSLLSNLMTFGVVPLLVVGAAGFTVADLVLRFNDGDE